MVRVFFQIQSLGSGTNCKYVKQTG